MTTDNKGSHRPPVDKEHARKLRLEITTLVGVLADRLPDDRLRRMRTFAYVGEWLELMHWLCADLTKLQIPVTPSERDALASALALFARPFDHYPYTNDPEKTLAALNVVEARSG